ncbi:MAG: tRNA dihydrouridine(20/20a) synthase DusA [Boseongicola sp.]
MQKHQPYRLSVAPMMDWTDRHCRYFHRLITRQTLLYTEMITAPALVRGNARHLLRFDPLEHPVALQLGGSDPAELAQAARMGADEGYDEINLNVGCPSDRVQSGVFGAVLMKSPDVVARCAEAMIDAVDVPVTVKCRIGVDEQVPEVIVPEFLRHLTSAGVTRVAIHARMAWLDGLSPKENRDIPPLNYDLVHAMKAEFPEITISVNGGITELADASRFLTKGLDGVMIGRAAYSAPWDVLAAADPEIFGEPAPFETPIDVVDAMRPYIEKHLSEGGRLHSITRHMLGLFTGRPGARVWRRTLSESVHREDAGLGLIDDALSAVSRQEAA